MCNIRQAQLDAIDRYLHYITESFDDWDWDGEELLIFLENEIIERYSFECLIEMIPNFENLCNL